MSENVNQHLREVAASGNENVEPFGFVPCAREHVLGKVCILPDGHEEALNPEDYIIQEADRYIEFVFQPTNEVLIATQVVSLETLLWRAEQHHAGVKNPKR